GIGAASDIHLRTVRPLLVVDIPKYAEASCGVIPVRRSISFTSIPFGWAQNRAGCKHSRRISIV
ncbi:hypothetical protein NO135_19885, partial [Clostridioides difficile]|nr:hypothetical protein [Clostridioides difficile]